MAVIGGEIRNIYSVLGKRSKKMELIKLGNK
jgi:hypothetical protein